MNPEVLANLSDNDLLALQSGDLSGVSDEGLAALSRQGVSIDFNFNQMVSNIPSDAAALAGDYASIVTNPVETATGMYKLISGLVQKATPGVQPNEAIVDAVGQALKKDYGSWEAVKRKIQNEPVHALNDVAGILTLGGAALSKAPYIGKAATTVNAAGKAVDPLNMVINAAKIPIKGLTPKGTPEAMMRSVVKSSFPRKNLAQNINTMLDEGIMPTTKGLTKLEDASSAISDKVADLIKKATDNGGVIEFKEVFKSLKELRDDLRGISSIGAAADFKKLKSVSNAIGSNLTRLRKAGKHSKYSVAELHELKRRLHKAASHDVKQNVVDPAVNRARKTMGRDAAGQVEKHVPAVKDLNARWGRLIELEEPLAKAARRIEGRDNIGLALPVNTGVGAMIGESIGFPKLVPAVTAAFTAGNSPKLKAARAIWLRKLHNQTLPQLGLDNSTTAALFRQGLLGSNAIGDLDQ
ncbi:MAG TPA: hypothetical protein EYQ44_02470 [Porticoccaceae bacterium]|nr:hypothetical protein [Porticoccaceae bacterium]